MSVQSFERNMDEVINSPYILSAKKISILLKDISGSKLFYELFDFCTSDFNYIEARNTYFSKNAAYGRRFVLPPDPKTIIAFGFSVLYCIDSHEEDLVSILNDYFYESNINAAYRRFAKELLVPFKREVLSAADAMINSREDDPVVVDNKGVRKLLLSEEDISMIKELLEQSKGVILQYKIEPDLKGELMALYDFFKSCLYEDEPEKIKIGYLGYKYGILYHKKHDAGLIKIEQILKNGGIL